MVKSKPKPRPKVPSKPAAAAVAKASTRSDAAVRRYWLFKSEPDVYGWSQLLADGSTFWNGVRNYQARNLLRDDIQVNDGVLFYHSNADPMAIVGIAKVVRAGYPDVTALDPKSDYYDPDSTPDDPTWFMVDIAPVATLPTELARDQLKGVAALKDMMLMQRGARLSVQPVTAAEWQAIVALAKVKVSW
jgi:predicted RNA-binding protein with PUA-like domain